MGLKKREFPALPSKIAEALEYQDRIEAEVVANAKAVILGDKSVNALVPRKGSKSGPRWHALSCPERPDRADEVLVGKLARICVLAKSESMVRQTTKEWVRELLQDALQEAHAAAERGELLLLRRSAIGVEAREDPLLLDPAELVHPEFVTDSAIATAAATLVGLLWLYLSRAGVSETKRRVALHRVEDALAKSVEALPNRRPPKGELFQRLYELLGRQIWLDVHERARIAHRIAYLFGEEKPSSDPYEKLKKRLQSRGS
jgi:hypothetical protein